MFDDNFQFPVVCSTNASLFQNYKLIDLLLVILESIKLSSFRCAYVKFGDDDDKDSSANCDTDKEVFNLI